MAKAPETFDKNEATVLKELYETTGFSHTSYTLADALFPDAEISSPEKLTAFNETREATERLMARGLVKAGEKHTGATGLYYNELRLTRKGDMAALNQRVTSAKTAMSEEDMKASRAALEKLKDPK
jgi:hypothetical protein